MSYTLPPGEIWTEDSIDAALVAAWSEYPRTSDATRILNLIPQLLAKYPNEATALQQRSFSFARKHSIGRLDMILSANGIPRPTYEKRWRRGRLLFCAALNDHEGRSINIRLDRDKSAAREIA